MTPAEFARISERLGHGYSFAVHAGEHLHTCVKGVPPEHPLFSLPCGRCYMDAQDDSTKE